MELKVFRLRGNAKLPTRAHDGDAGMDLYYCAAKNDHTSISVRPGETALFPTGIKAEVPKGFMLEVKNKSSVAAKKQLLVGACVVDSGYDGEVFVNLHNIGKETQYVRPADKIAQLVLIPVVHFRAFRSRSGNLYRQSITISDRGDGALGSTDA